MKKKFVFKLKKIYFLGLYIFGILTLAGVLFSLLEFGAKIFETLIPAIICGIGFLIIVFLTISNARLKIEFKDKKVYIRNRYFKNYIIDFNDLSKISIVNTKYNNSSNKNYTQKDVEFYNKKNELIVRIKAFALDEADYFNDLRDYLKEFDILIQLEEKPLKTNRKLSFKIILFASLFFTCAITVVLFVMNYSYAKVINSKIDDLTIVEGKISNIESTDSNYYLYLDGSNEKNYEIPSFIRLIDECNKIKATDNLRAHYTTVLGNNVLLELSINDNLIYDLNHSIEGAKQDRVTYRIAFICIYSLDLIGLIGLYLIFKHLDKKELEYKNNLDKYHSVDIEGIHHYDISYKKLKEDLLKENMLSKIVLDGIYIFKIKNNNDEFYIGYSHNHRKAIIDAFIDKEYVVISDDLSFSDNNLVSFNEDDRLQFEKSFPEIEKLTKVSPIFENDYEKIIEKLEEKDN